MKHGLAAVGFWTWSLCLAGALSGGGCTAQPAERMSAPGTLQFALSATSTHGVTYRLVDAVFQITGASNVQIETSHYSDSEFIRRELKAGNYAISLNPNWKLERATVEGAFEAAQAVLLSPNPQTFTIKEQATTSVRFGFRASQDEFELGNGSLALGIEVQDDAASPRKLVLDDINSGALASWTIRELATNPVLTCEEISSPYDGSIAIRKTAVGTTYEACSHAYLARRFPLGSVASTDRARLWMYLSLSSDLSTYNLPGVQAIVYRNGTAQGMIWYYQPDTTGAFYLNRASNTEPQGFRQLGPNGYQSLPLDKLAGLDPPYPVVAGPVEFDEIEVVFVNYLCVGTNSLTFDAISLEY